MHCDQVGACFSQFGKEGVGVCRHQMTVEIEIGDGSDAAYDRDAEGDVGHEMTVHHIEMEPFHALFDTEQFSFESRKVGSEQ